MCVFVCVCFKENSLLIKCCCWGRGASAVEKTVIYKADLHEYALAMGCVGVCKGGAVCVRTRPTHTTYRQTDTHSLAGGEIVNERERDRD